MAAFEGLLTMEQKGEIDQECKCVTWQKEMDYLIVAMGKPCNHFLK